MAITDALHRGALESLTRLRELCRLAAPGSVLIQLRDRELSDQERLALGRELKAIVSRDGQRLAVNDRADLALLLVADALHLPEGGMHPADARRLLGPSVWLSSAIHAPEATAGDVDALVLSPIAAARKGNPALGLEALKRARRAQGPSPRRKLIYALGGITPDNAAQMLEAGADGIAVMGGLFADKTPEPLLANLGILR